MTSPRPLFARHDRSSARPAGAGPHDVVRARRGRAIAGCRDGRATEGARPC